MVDLFDAVRQQLGYMLSLPERTMRSVAAVVGGTTSLLTDTILPESLRGTAFYQVLIGGTQRFVIEKMAQIPTAAGTTDNVTSAGYVPRKLVGSALETAGLFAMHFSPLWVFAMASDAAGGGNVFLNRLAERLKQNRVIPKETEITGITDLLQSIQDTSRRSASAVDSPPLSREEISRLAANMTAEYRQMFAKATNLVPRLETIWQRMQDVARKEHVSVESLSGVLTVDVASWARRGFGAVLSVGQTGTDLFGEKVLDSYAQTLDAVSKEGLTDYINNRMKPFLQSAAAHFDPGKKTWTEKILGIGDETLETAGEPQQDHPTEAHSTDTATTPVPPPPPAVSI